MTPLPHIAVFADHQIITPPNRLSHAIEIGTAHDVDDAVARAEKALAALSEKFPVWMQAEWAKLAFAHAEIVADGFTDNATERLLQIARDIRGNAPLYGFTSVAEIADSLCRLFDDATTRIGMPRALVTRHIDAIGAIVRGVPPDSSTVVLRDAVTQHLLRASAMTIAAPPLAPD